MYANSRMRFNVLRKLVSILLNVLYNDNILKRIKITFRPRVSRDCMHAQIFL